MAIKFIPYPGLSESLRSLRKQVIDSLPYSVRNLPTNLKSPEEVFKFCKSKFIYENDPKGIELFQTVPTLLTNNELGTPGAGDCDDATIFCLTMLLINGFIDCGIVLAGRSDSTATHIYAYCVDNGQKKLLDLTTNKFNKEGGHNNYTHRQFIPFKISKNQLDMFLQLADGAKPRKRRIIKMTDKQKEQGIYIPSKNVFVPVEKFDKLPIHHAKKQLLGEGYAIEQLSEYLSGRAERKAKKKEKQQYKTAKRSAKLEKKSAKSEKIRAKAQKKRDSGEAKKMRAKAKQMKQDRKNAEAESGEESPFSKFTSTAGAVVGSMFSPEEEQPEEVEGEETEGEETTDTEQGQDNTDENQELEEGTPDFNRNDGINLGIFALGFFLEKTKRVA